MSDVLPARAASRLPGPGAPAASRPARSARHLFWLPVFAAILHVASLPGWMWGPLVFLSIVPRIAYWERGGPWWGDSLGGYVFWFLTFSFLEHTSWFMVAGAAFMLWWTWNVERFFYMRIRRLLPPSAAAPLALAFCYYFRLEGPMNGMPWGSLALGLHDVPGALFLARGVGETGLAVLVAFAGAWLYACFRRRSAAELWIAPGLWAAALLAAAVGPGPPETVGTVRALAVQPNLAIDDKVGAATMDQTFDANLAPVRAAWGEGVRPEIALWAETMYPYPMVPPELEGIVRRPMRGRPEPWQLEAQEVLRAQRRTIREITAYVEDGGYFITGSHFYRGIPADSPPGDISPRTTEMLAFDKDGRLVAHRPKSRLVPFGETLPFEGALPGSQAVAQWIFDVFGLHPLIDRASAGAPLELPWADGRTFRLGSAVCWENPYESVFRAQCWEGAEAFCVLSNEAWFGLGAEMDQMIASTRYRAAETGRALLRVTNTGQTVLVHQDSSLGSWLPRGEPGWLAADLPRVPGGFRSSYLVVGWALLPAAAAAAVLLLLCSYLPARRRLDHFPDQG